MSKRKIYMIGNSHIDPIWLWRRAEGMQEVKSTFASALERMKEFPEFKFTISSGAFLEWTRDNAPALFEEIRERVKEGRWEIVGGMWVEPDCILPSGEALIRHFLYTKDFVQREFGVEPHVGYSVDSFGHGSNMPAILQGCGMDSYLVCRPSKEYQALPPVFMWQAPDGSTVKAERTGGEYLAWTRPGIENNLSESEAALDEAGQNTMAVFYGVGNHGGGPTIDNIKCIRELKDEREDLELDFGTLDEFFGSLDESSLPVFKGELGRIFAGCYSADNEIKRLNRRAEWMLHRAEALHAIANGMADMQNTPGFDREGLDRAWKELLFMQFHDSLSGTCIEPARDEITGWQAGALAAGRTLADNGIQRIAAGLDTRGEGFPLILANPSGAPFKGVVQADVYCPRAEAKHLRVRGTKGEEITAIETDYHKFTPPSRKVFIFEAEIPAMGWAVYRVIAEGPNEPVPECRIVARDGVLDNGIVRIELDKKTGCPKSIQRNGRETLAAPARFGVFTDERGSWGTQDVSCHSDEPFVCTAIEEVECNPLRGILRTTLAHAGSTLVLDWLLEKDADSVTVNAIYHNTEKHAQVCLIVPVAGKEVGALTETAFLAEDRATNDDKEFYQHRFADIRGAKGAGLAVYNDSAYGMRLAGNEYRLILSRSCMFARMDEGGPVEMSAAVRFADQGEWKFTLALMPHSEAVSNLALFQWADRYSLAPDMLYDSLHDGPQTRRRGTPFGFSGESVQLAAAKPALDGSGDVILRLVEVNGAEGTASVQRGTKRWEGSFTPHEIKTLRLSAKEFAQCDMLERKKR